MAAIRPQICYILMTGVFLAVLPDTARAVLESQPVATKEPVFLEAEEVGYDQKNAVVVARGRVEVLQGDRILNADLITYDQKSNIVYAAGNVSLLNSDGNVYFAENVELQNDMKEGVIRNFSARLSDNSLFAAREARKISASKIELDKAVYSPCKLCEEDPSRAPLWQIKADKVVLDDDEQTITYDDATFEVYGVPVAYTPYLSHATPDADNKSGFLAPEYNLSESLGLTVHVPYYYTIAPDKDFTVTPIITTKEGPVLAGEYRQLTDNGSFEFKGSGTYPERRDALGNVTDGNEFRGHIDARGVSQLSDVWGWGFNIKRATDDTYLRRYKFSDEDVLTSRIYTEGIKGRGYAIAQGLAFQGLRQEDDPDREPLILPLIDGMFETDPMIWGSRFSIKGNAMALARDLGPQSRRLSFTGGWRLPYVTGNGHVFELATQLRGDGYSVDDVPEANGETFEGATGRFVPQATLGWRYPLINRLGTETSLIVEPVVNAVISPHGHNPDEIPNEDNDGLEFTDTNLFSANRFPGYDRVEGGPRVNYGIRTQLNLEEGRNINLLLGQDFTEDDNGAFPLSDEPDTNFSDFVGRMGLVFLPFDVNYRFRLDRETFAPRRNEVYTTFSHAPVDFMLSYIGLDNDRFLGDREEVLSAMSFLLNENWTFTASGRRDLLEDGGWVSANAGLIFHNECLTVLTNLNREFTRDRDIEPSTSLGLRVSLKNLN